MDFPIELDAYGLNDDRLKEVYEIFDLNGYINDVQANLSASFMEYQFHLLNKPFKTFGYVGNDLITKSIFYSDSGKTLYWIFDDSRISYEDSLKMMQKWIDQNKAKHHY